ncbi:MAG: hypothetical protein PHV39_08205 [Methanomicrobium sp.]|nr:hypothetical protein [Methanomicrobium sp.]
MGPDIVFGICLLLNQTISLTGFYSGMNIDEQIKELSYNLKPALRGCSSVNTVCRGLPGTGKTTCLKKLFSEAESWADSVFALV